MKIKAKRSAVEIKTRSNVVKRKPVVLTTEQQRALLKKQRRDAYINKVLPCIHRGDDLEWIKCHTCQGNTSYLVKACAVNGKCSMSSKSRLRSDVQYCKVCPDVKAA